MTRASETSDTGRASSLYRAVWRWHFVAGLLVLPVLLLVAITGGLYLFKPELDHLIYRSLQEVPVRTAPQASMAGVIENVERKLGGKVLQITLSDRADASVHLLVRDRDGKALSAFADPYDGHLLGAIRHGGVMQVVRKLHSLQLFGFWASSLVEIAAAGPSCWSGRVYFCGGSSCPPASEQPFVLHRSKRRAARTRPARQQTFLSAGRKRDEIALPCSRTDDFLCTAVRQW